MPIPRKKVYHDPLTTIKVHARVNKDLDHIQELFGIPSRRAAMEACIATMASQIRDNTLNKLIAQCPELETQGKTQQPKAVGAKP